MRKLTVNLERAIRRYCPNVKKRGDQDMIHAVTTGNHRWMRGTKYMRDYRILPEICWEITDRELETCEQALYDRYVKGE